MSWSKLTPTTNPKVKSQGKRCRSLKSLEELKKDAKKDKQATGEPTEQAKGKRPTAKPLATSTGEPASDTTTGGTTEVTTLTAEEEALLKPTPSGKS